MANSPLHKAGALQRLESPSIRARPTTTPPGRRGPFAPPSCRARYRCRYTGIPVGPNRNALPRLPVRGHNGSVIQVGRRFWETGRGRRRVQRTAIFSGVFLGSVVVSSAWGAPPDESVLSAEIWQGVARLQRAGESPHLTIDCRDVLHDVSIVRDPDGDLYLQTRGVAHPTGLASRQTAVAEAQQLVDLALAASLAIPAGQSPSCKAPTVQIEIVDLDGASFEILLYEPIQAGRRQASNT